MSPSMLSDVPYCMKYNGDKAAYYYYFCVEFAGFMKK